MSAPPMDGPATWASDRLPLKRALAATYSSRLATVTNSVVQAMSNATDSVPTMKATTYSWPRLREPVTYVTAIEPMARARNRSAPIIIRRRR